MHYFALQEANFERGRALASFRSHQVIVASPDLLCLIFSWVSGGNGFTKSLSHLRKHEGAWCLYMMPKRSHALGLVTAYARTFSRAKSSETSYQRPVLAFLGDMYRSERRVRRCMQMTKANKDATTDRLCQPYPLHKATCSTHPTSDCFTNAADHHCFVHLGIGSPKFSFRHSAGEPDEYAQLLLSPLLLLFHTWSDGNQQELVAYDCQCATQVVIMSFAKYVVVDAPLSCADSKNLPQLVLDLFRK